MILDHNAQIFAVIVGTGFNPGKNRLPVLTQTMEYVTCLSSLAFVVGISKVYSELILKQGNVRTVEVFCHPCPQALSTQTVLWISEGSCREKWE